MGDRTMEDVLEVAWPVHDLRTATADGPVFSEDGTLAVIRLDPELAAFLNKLADLPEEIGWYAEADALRRAARIIGGEQSDG